MNQKVNNYIGQLKTWQEAIKSLRMIVLEFPLTEDLKWGKPCYSYKNTNIIIIHAFKEYCGLMFFKGSLLKNVKGLLVKPGENTQGGRLLKFTNEQEILKLKTTIKTYIKEAIEIEKAGLKIESSKATLELPKELTEQFKKNIDFKKAFLALTPGRQRAYDIFFTAAKQSETRISRIEKYRKQILSGKGMNDCTCGLSQKMPYCDGSHKLLKTN